MKRVMDRVKWLYFSMVISIVLSGCGKTVEEVPLDEINLEADIVRFDILQREAAHRLFEDSTLSPLVVFQENLAKEKSFILEFMNLRTDTIVPDSALAFFFASRLRHPDFVALLDSVEKIFPAKSELEKSFINPLKRLHFYFPGQKIPRVRFFVSGYLPTAEAGLDNLLITENFLGVGLHFYLGAGFSFYPPDLPMYLRRRCTPNHVLPQVFSKIAETILPPPDLSKQPVLIDEMVKHGIQLYFLDKVLPDTEDSVKIYYTSQQMQWALKNEAPVYKAMIESLYSTDVKIHRQYVEESPFTANFSRESPPRLGQYIGWQIVRSYMKSHPDVTLEELVKSQDYQAIFQESKYRPK